MFGTQSARTTPIDDELFSGSLMTTLIQHISRRQRFVFLIAVVVIATQCLWTQTLRDLQLQSETFGSAGTEFWFAIPPNEFSDYPADDLVISISSMYDTEITVTRPDKSSFTRLINRGRTRLLSTSRGETDWSWEVRSSETVADLGIRITAKDPVVVYVLSSKRSTTDGFLVLPKHQLGLEYFVTSYWDFKEVKPWAGGFIVVASEDNTKVEIDLRGVGGNLARTAGGRQIGTGKPLTVTLNAGQVYMVKGDATTRAAFDLSGTRVTSDKPIGLIPFHERTTMPNMLTNGNGRNTLNEMALPVSLCGKKYFTSNVNRQSVNGLGRGDVYRVIATADNTEWYVWCYDKTTRQRIRTEGGLLAKAGDFVEISQAQLALPLLDGYAEWTADKPVYISQFTPSASFDGDPAFDPFMWNNVAQEFWPRSVFFSLSQEDKFADHHVTVFVDIGPNTDSSMLDSVRLNGVRLVGHPNTVTGRGLLNGRIPQTQVFVTSLIYRDGVDSVFHVTGTSATRFYVTVAGVGNTDAYGWSTGARHPNIVALDTMSPVVRQSSTTMTSVAVTITERRNDPSPVRPLPLPSDQVESGICVVWLDSASNIRLTSWVRPTSGKLDSTTVNLEQIDPLKPSFAKLAAMDYAGNVSSQPFAISVDDRPLLKTTDAGRVRTGTTLRTYAVLSNRSSAPITITSVTVSGTALDTASWRIVTPTPFVIPALTTDSIILDFAPTVPYVSIASCTVVTNVGPLAGPLTARSVAPRIAVSSRSIVPPSMDDFCDTVVRIRNIGDDTLTVSRIESSNLSIRVPPIAQPIRLAPNADTAIRICYMPTKEGVDTAIITTYSDAFQRAIDTTTLLGIYGTTAVWYGAKGAAGISPHPVRDVLTITFSETIFGEGSYDIIDLTGVAVQRGHIVLNPQSSMDIPAQELPVGSYVLRLTIGTRTTSVVFVKAP